jgi:hypothetical protein
MTKLMRIIEADRKASGYQFRMTGVVTKSNFFEIVKSFGVVKALRVLVSGKGTALAILMS